MRYPDFLKEGDTIGFVAPSFGCAQEPYRTAFENALAKWREQGYGTDPGPNCYSDGGVGISSTPVACGRELTEYYLSENNRALISCGGGELMCEILEYVDFEALKKAPPKWYMGYSDNTNFIFLSATLCDTAAIYGPCAAAFGMEPRHKALEDAMDLLTGKTRTVESYGRWEKESQKSEENPLASYHCTEPLRLRLFTPGGAVNSVEVNGRNQTADLNETGYLQMKGRLIGGCMDCLVNLLGTEFDRVTDFLERYKEDGFIWFLEACDLNVFSIRRAMWQMEKAGWFKYVKGFLMGRPLCHGQEMMGMDQYGAVLPTASVHGVPVIFDADLGHLPPMMPLVVGSVAQITAEPEHLKLEMEYR